MTRSFKYRQGVTLLEMILAVAILGIVAFLGTLVIQFLNNAGQEKIISEADREAQIVLYQISKDVRNAEAIVQINDKTESVEFPSIPYPAATPPVLFRN